MPLATADLILFAIRASVRLANAGRKAFIEGAQDMELTLPLPSSFFPAQLDIPQQAFNMMRFLQNDTDARLVEDYKTCFLDNNGNEYGGDALVAAYLQYLNSGRGWSRQANKSNLVEYEARDLFALATVRQWDKSPNPTTIQRIGGALIEVAVDYFVTVPGALNENSNFSRSVKTFLEGIQDARFQEDRWDGILLNVFSAGLETLSKNPDIYSRNAADDALLRTAVTGLLDDVKGRMDKIRSKGADELTAQDRMSEAGSAIVVGLITGSSRAVLNNPEVLGLSTDADHNLVQGVGTALLELLTGDLDPEATVSQRQQMKALSSGLRRIASTGGLEKLTHAALKVAAENPSLIRAGSAEVNAWLRSVIRDLYALYPDRLKLFKGESGAIEPELFTDIAYLLLDNGIENFEPLLAEKVGAGKSALLVQVAGSVLDAVATVPQPGQPVSWRLKLTESDVRYLLDSNLQALARHPEWITDNPQKKQLVPAATGLLTSLLVGNPKAAFGQRVKILLRSDQLADFLAAVLSSGLIPLDEVKLQRYAENSEKLSAGLNLVMEHLYAGGLKGLDQLANFATLHDLFLILAEKELMEVLLSGTSPEQEQLLGHLDKLLNGLKRGELVTLADLRGVA